MSKSIANRLQAIQRELREIQHLHHDQDPTFWAVLTAWEATDLAIHVANQSKPKILADKDADDSRSRGTCHQLH